jgi:hypothetical protein
MGVVSPKVHTGDRGGNMDHDSPDIVVSATDHPSSSSPLTDHQQQQQFNTPSTKQELLRQKDHQEDLMMMNGGINSQLDMKATDYTEHVEQQKQKPPPTVGDDDFDMFATDVDIFAESETTGPASSSDIPAVPVAVAHADANPTLNDNWDDSEGYYSKSTHSLTYKSTHNLPIPI